MQSTESNPPVRNSFQVVQTLVFGVVALAALGQGAALAQTISWIDVGVRNESCGGAANIAFNPTTSRLYQAGWGDTGATVAVIDVATNEVTYVQMPGFAFFACFDFQEDQGQYLVVNSATNRIYMLGNDSEGLALAMLDGATNIVTYLHPFGAEQFFPYTGLDVAIAIDPNTNRLYFAGAPRGDDGPIVVVVDGVTHDVVRRYSQPTWVDPAWPGVACRFTPSGGIAVNPNTNRVYITGTGAGRSCDRFLAVIDGGTGEFTVLPKFVRSADPIEYFVASRSGQVTVDTSANRVYVRGGSSTLGGVDEVIAVDEATGEMEVISTASASPEGGMVVNSLTRRLYVCRRPAALSLIDLVTGDERIAVDLPPGWSFAFHYNPEPAVDEGRNRLYVLSDGWIVVIDLGTSEVPPGSGVSGTGRLSVDRV